MNGKTVLITGGTGGIGKQTAIGLAKLGSHLIVTGRDQKRGEEAIQEIQDRSGNKHVDLLLADLSVQAEVRRLAREVKENYPSLHVLINNAGLLESKRRVTADGVEAHFAVNVVAPYLLTLELLPLLKVSTPARVINLTGGMPGSHLRVDDLQAEKSFTGLFTYTRAKSAMSAMSLEMAKRLEGSGVSINVVYPGGAATSMTGAMTPETLPFAMRLMWPIFKTMQKPDDGKSAQKASRSSIYAATAPELEGLTGQYITTNSKRVKWPASFQNEHNRQKVWSVLEELTGSRLPNTQANLSPFTVGQARGIV
ncbi:MAG: SDR family NAD(P)-dependent oxidoreductase [Trueperaceae bacterium]